MAPTIKAWMNQSQDYYKLEQQIADTKKQNENLKAKLKELSEPNYIATQARQRLGYVRKGETTYVVIDPETVTKEKQSTTTNTNAPRKPWFGLIKDSIKTVEELKTTKKKVAVDTSNQNTTGTPNNTTEQNNQNNQNTQNTDQNTGQDTQRNTQNTNTG